MLLIIELHFLTIMRTETTDLQDPLANNKVYFKISKFKMFKLKPKLTFRQC